MTAAGAQATSVADDDRGLGVTLGGGTQPSGDASADGRRVLARRLLVMLMVGAVLVPLALFTWRALHAPVNFDGGMNLQVAQRLAGGEGYTRFYHELRTFPHEVQTNGPYMYLAALGIEVFGPGQFSYQFGNLVFVGGFLAVVSLMLRRESIGLRLVGPALVLIAVPLIPTYGLGGLGEVPTTFFLFAAVLALVEAVRSPPRAPWWVLAASVAFGAAFTTKTFAVGASAALATGLLCVVVAAPTRRLRWRVVLATVAAPLIVVAREIHRLMTLGSIDGYRAWWANQRGSISTQSGLESTGGGGLVQTFLDHMHVLSGLFDFPAELLLVILFLPLAWAVGLFLWRWRGQGLRRTLTDPYMVTVLMVGVLAASYVLWWMILVPDNKAWIRRIIPGVLAIHLLYLFMVPWLVRAVRAALGLRGATTSLASSRTLPAIAAFTGIALIAVTAGAYAWDKVVENTEALVLGEEPWLEANRDAADYIQANDDLQYFGDEWWSAPVVSLMSSTDFMNLGVSDFCSLDPARDRLVWDSYAMTIRSQDPWTRDGKLVFDEMASFGSFVTIYAVGPAPDLCD